MESTLYNILLGLLILFLVWASNLFQLLKTLFLIIRIKPFRRFIKDAPQILVLGDSTGYGTGAQSGKDSIAGRIGIDFPSYTIKNISKNGRTIGELVPIAHEVSGEYALILLQIGGNDILQRREVGVVERELKEIIRTLSKHTPNLVMISSGNVGGAVRFTKQRAIEYEQLTRQFRNMFIATSKTTELVYVDLFLEPEVDIFILKPEKYFSIDGLHPSSAGYASWYDRLKPVLLEKLH